MIDEYAAETSETLRTWLKNNRKLIGEFDPHLERTQLHSCQEHIRSIRAELVSRAE